jgi:hypothetical protein
MTEQTTAGDQAKTQASKDAWHEVGERFEALGASLRSAFQTAWEDESNQAAVRQIESGLRTVARSIADAVDEAAISPEGQQVRVEVEQAAEEVRAVGEQAAEEARPHVAAAMASLRDGLQAVIDQLDRARRPKGAAAEEDAPEG